MADVLRPGHAAASMLGSAEPSLRASIRLIPHRTPTGSSECSPAQCSPTSAAADMLGSTEGRGSSLGPSPMRRPHRLSGCGGEEAQSPHPPLSPRPGRPSHPGQDSLLASPSHTQSMGVRSALSQAPSPSPSGPGHSPLNHHLPSYLAAGPIPHASLRSISPLRSGALAGALQEGRSSISGHASPTRHAPSHLGQALQGSPPPPTRSHMALHFSDAEYVPGQPSFVLPPGSPMHTLGRSSPAVQSPSAPHTVHVPASLPPHSPTASPTRVHMAPPPTTITQGPLSPTHPPRLGAGGAPMQLGARGGPGVVSSGSGTLTLLPATCGAAQQGMQLESLSHRPPTPMGGEEQVAQVSRHFSTRRRMSRFALTAEEGADEETAGNLRGHSMDGGPSGPDSMQTPGTSMPQPNLSRKSMPSLVDLARTSPVSGSGAGTGDAPAACERPERRRDVGATKLGAEDILIPNQLDALTSFMKGFAG